MAISRPPGPPRGTEIVERAVRDLMKSGPTSFSAAPDASPGQVSQPIRRFLLKLGDITDDDFLKRATPIGWRYLIISQGPIAVGDVKETESGAATFDSLIHGRIAERLVSAAELAADKYGADQKSFDVRILEIPAIYMSALWLHGPQDIFIPFLEGGASDAQPVREAPSFAQRVMAAAKLKRT